MSMFVFMCSVLSKDLPNLVHELVLNPSAKCTFHTFTCIYGQPAHHFEALRDCPQNARFMTGMIIA